LSELFNINSKSNKMDSVRSFSNPNLIGYSRF
jgi:hypothetical protein